MHSPSMAPSDQRRRIARTSGRVKVKKSVALAAAILVVALTGLVWYWTIGHRSSGKDSELGVVGQFILQQKFLGHFQAVAAKCGIFLFG